MLKVGKFPDKMKRPKVQEKNDDNNDDDDDNDGDTFLNLFWNIFHTLIEAYRDILSNIHGACLTSWEKRGDATI